MTDPFRTRPELQPLDERIVPAAGPYEVDGVFDRVAFARLWQNDQKTVNGPDAAERVGAALRDLRPTEVAGLVRLGQDFFLHEKDAGGNWVAKFGNEEKADKIIADYRAVRIAVRQTAPDAKFDFVLNADDVIADGDDGTLFIARMKLVEERFDPDVWFLDFFSNTYNQGREGGDETELARIRQALANVVAYAHSRDGRKDWQPIGGNFFSGEVVGGVDYVAVNDLELRTNQEKLITNYKRDGEPVYTTDLSEWSKLRERQIRDLGEGRKGVPVLAHMFSGNVIKEEGWESDRKQDWPPKFLPSNQVFTGLGQGSPTDNKYDRYWSQDTREQYVRLLADYQDDWGYRLMYPVFHPLYFVDQEKYSYDSTGDKDATPGPAGGTDPATTYDAIAALMREFNPLRTAVGLSASAAAGRTGDAVQLTATVTDWTGAAVATPGRVHFFVRGTDVSGEGVLVRNGQAVLRVAAGEAGAWRDGDNVLTASFVPDAESGYVGSESKAVHYGLRQVAHHLRVEPNKDPVAGEVFGLTVTVVDRYDHRVKGYTGAVTVGRPPSAAGGFGVLPLAYQFTAADGGRHTVRGLRTQVAAEYQFPVTAAGLPEKSFAVTVAAGPLDHFDVTLAAPGSQVRPGVAFDIVITARDRYGNPVTGFDGDVKLRARLAGSPQAGAVLNGDPLPVLLPFPSGSSQLVVSGLTLSQPGKWTLIANTGKGESGEFDIRVR